MRWGRGGWLLSQETRTMLQGTASAAGQVISPVAAVTYRLDYLRASLEQAEAIMRSRPEGVSMNYAYDGTLMGYVELARGEAVAILDGADPLGVLLPLLRVRSLTHEELMT
jgi:hypothetical protein